MSRELTLVPGSDRQTAKRREPQSAALWFATIAVVTGIGAYFKMLTGFNAYDDEGMLMISVRQFIEGKALYDYILSVYGPLYYFYNLLLRDVTHTPVSHDVVRISSLLPWLLSSLFCARAVWALTRSLPWAAVAQVGVWMLCVFFRSEPGHPQELALLLVTGLIALISTTTGKRMSAWHIAGAGALAGGMTLVKINLGVFAVAALAMALLIEHKGGKFARISRFSVSAVYLLMPFLLMNNRLDQEWVRVYCFVVTAGAAAFLIHTFRWRQQGTLLWHCFAGVCGFASILVVVLVFTIGRGTTISALRESLVTNAFTVFIRLRDWQVPLVLLGIWVPWGIAGIGTAVLFARAREGGYQHDLRVIKALFSAAGLLFFGAAFLIGRQIPGLALPFCWLVLWDPDRPVESSFPRVFLAAYVVVQTLCAFPTAGSQVNFISVPILLVVLVCAADSTRWLASCRFARHKFYEYLPVTCLCGCVLVAGLTSASHHSEYRALPPLDLPGATRVHVPADQRQELQWIAQNLRDHCEAFEALPGMPSLYFWSGIDPLTGYNADGWMLGMPDRQQTAIVEALSRKSKACAVYSPVLEAFWNRSGKDWGSQPLVRYIHEGFRVVGRSGKQFDYHFMVRKDDPLLRGVDVPGSFSPR